MKESILYNIYQSGKYLSLLLFFLIACDDLEDKPSLVPGESGDVYETGTAEMYILSEGLFNQNNSSLARYSFNQQKRTSNYFSANNQRGLGDTANDMAIYGNKIYIVVNVSILATVPSKEHTYALSLSKAIERGWRELPLSRSICI